MDIIINHIPDFVETTEKEITVEEFIKIKNFNYKFLIVKINEVLVKVDNYSSATITSGDNVQIIHLITRG